MSKTHSRSNKNRLNLIIQLDTENGVFECICFITQI